MYLQDTKTVYSLTLVELKLINEEVDEIWGNSIFNNTSIRDLTLNTCQFSEI